MSRLRPFDADVSAAWVEGVGGTGEGLQITVSFNRPTTIRTGSA